MDGWLNAKVTYLVTSSQGQKNVYYTMPDDFTAIIKNARQSCANAYNSLPSRVSHENELIDDSSAKQDLVNKLSAELSELKDKFEKEKNAFYESHPTIANETSNKSYKTFLGYVICVILCIASRLIWHIPIVIEIIALIIGFILLTLYNDISISNLEDKYFSAELKSLKTSVSDKEDELSKAKKEYDSAVSILQDFQKTKK
jgi:hypothetical protein